MRRSMRSFDDLESVATAGKNRIDATIGSVLDLFGGALPYRKVVVWFAGRGFSFQ